MPSHTIRERHKKRVRKIKKVMKEGRMDLSRVLDSEEQKKKKSKRLFGAGRGKRGSGHRNG